jgi:hypothetical protein
VLPVLGVLAAGALVELEPEAALELLALPPFIAVSNSWRLTEPSWFASTLLKSRLELDEDLLPPLAEVDCLPFCFIAASHSLRLSLPSWFESALLKSSFCVELDVLVLPEVALLSLLFLVESLA